MIAVPLKWHPALDAYRALMMRFCDYELGGIPKWVENRENFKDINDVSAVSVENPLLAERGPE
jgi:hypothetical protein